MLLALPGSKGCFSILQEALGNAQYRIRINKTVRDQLLDFQWMTESLSFRPMHLAEVVLTPPSYFSAMDTAKDGMGGVWFSPLLPVKPLAICHHKLQQLQHPILWQVRFSEEIQKQLVSFNKPTGSVTNSDLELSGVIAHKDIIVQALPPSPHLSTCAFSNNTPVVSWKFKVSTSMCGPAAYLLQSAALHKQHYCYDIKMHYLPGHLNTMADNCSCLWSLSDSQLVSYFNSTYPQPNTWKMHHLWPVIHSTLTCNFLKKLLQPDLYLHELPWHNQLGPSGSRFAT